MKKVGIITIIDNLNCGNRLQNYALQEVIKTLQFDVYTIRNHKLLNSKEHFFVNFLKFCKRSIKSLFHTPKSFRAFNKHISFSKEYACVFSKRIDKHYDYFVCGSDQIWKPTRMRMSPVDLLSFATPHKRISYAASFGLNEIESTFYPLLKNELPLFKAISVREEAGKKIIKEATGLENVQVVLDPTMMISASDWEKLETKPNSLEDEHYIFAYFLGDEEVSALQKQLAGSQVQLVDFSSHQYGPSEFLYLIHHADLVLTDSFHASVFSIIFHTPFYVFDRKQEDKNNNMNSRMDTLLKTFSLEDRKQETVAINHQEIMWNDVDSILRKEQEKSKLFLEKALDLS